AKETGKNKTSYFKKRIAKRAYDFIEMDRALFQALKYKQFTLCYQPKIDSTTHKPIGSEALIRWYSPSKGFISPNDFIPHAEMNGDILAIEQWVIERAVAFQRKLRNMGSTGQPVSINISGKSLINEETPLVLERILAKYQVSPCEVEIEITETAVIKDMEKAVKHLMKLKKIGVKVALDDFGTGYSSLTQLKDLPIDIVKLDQSFLTNICEDQESEKIFKAVVGLCHELGLQVVAEGVETIEQLSKAKEYECDIIQGYYFSMPLMQDAYVEYLKEEGFEGLNWGRK
ncbi:MAG TPA: hypothetical protein DHN33_06730, partial [Eubacteriaceae bacterium]|nr:hypothetical protein [Eubacteriaceae bacterium]